MAHEAFGVPKPVAARDGRYLHVLQGRQVDVLEWLPGRPLGATETGIDHDDRTSVFHRLGREMARLHSVSDAWAPPKEFSRWSWDRNGLVGDAPLWGPFWENPTLASNDSAMLRTFRTVADQTLAKIEGDLDFGLIHADLVRENVMVDGDRMWLIDFDDAGFGFRLFDIATTLLKNLHEPDFDQLKHALLSGYQSVRPLDTTHLDLFMALRAATYVGWIVPRLHDDGADIRNARFLETARWVLGQHLQQNT